LDSSSRLTTSSDCFSPYLLGRLRDRLRGVKALAAVGGAIFVAALAPFVSGCGITPTCTAGVAGTDLMVTASGDNAQAFCDAFVKAQNGSGYIVDQPDNSGTLMCRYTIRDGTTVTVRDKGVLKLYGSSECDQLKQQQ